MTNLGDFGFDVDEPEEQDNDDEGETETRSSNPQYHTGRCRAINTDGKRCASAVAGSNISDDDPDLCHMHDIQHKVRTIDDSPVDLIEATSRKRFQDLDDLDVDADLIRRTVHAIHGLDGWPIEVTEKGVVLPHRHAAADRLVIRTPTATVQSTFTGDGAVRPAPFPTARRRMWEDEEPDSDRVRNSKCLTLDQNSERYSIGLKIFGHEQEWYPVQFRDPTQIDHEDDTAEPGGERQ